MGLQQSQLFFKNCASNKIQRTRREVDAGNSTKRISLLKPNQSKKDVNKSIEYHSESKTLLYPPNAAPIRRDGTSHSPPASHLPLSSDVTMRINKDSPSARCSHELTQTVSNASANLHESDHFCIGATVSTVLVPASMGRMSRTYEGTICQSPFQTYNPQLLEVQASKYDRQIQSLPRKCIQRGGDVSAATLSSTRPSSRSFRYSRCDASWNSTFNRDLQRQEHRPFDNIGKVEPRESTFYWMTHDLREVHCILEHLRIILDSSPSTMHYGTEQSPSQYALDHAKSPNVRATHLSQMELHILIQQLKRQALHLQQLLVSSETYDNC